MGRLRAKILSLLLLGALPVGVLGDNVLKTSGFSTCMNDPTVKVTQLNVQYDQTTRQLVFDVAGSSSQEQKVKAELIISAYGKVVTTKDFNPCDLNVDEMCPIPAGTFSGAGKLPIPQEEADQIPSLAFNVPDLDGNVQMKLTNIDTGKQVACIQSNIGNGKTLQMKSISYVAGGIALAALAFSGVSAVAAGGHPGASTASPTFGEVVVHFQGMAMNGMLSVDYPQVFRSWTANFGFSTGLITWGGLQRSIDSFRAHTGGNLTDASYEYLKQNATLVFSDGTNSSDSDSLGRRALDTALIFARQSGTATVDGQTQSVGGGSNGGSNSGDNAKQNHVVSGIQAYAEQLAIPDQNTFMTILLVWCIVVAAIIVGVLLIKVILEAWGLCGKLPKSLESWRKRYWWRMAKGITNLIFILYGAWTLWCIYQFTNGDSWAAKLLAGLTLGLFTILLAGFTWRIWVKARQFKKMDGDADRLYEDKETWIKYSLFYDNFKKRWYLFFVPTIIYMFAKGVVMAAANNHGLVQAGGQIIVEVVMLGLVLWMRPFQRTSGQWINIVIHVVRVISICVVLIFVEELGVQQTTKQIAGMVLVIVQAALTAILGILIAVNGLIICIKENPHRRARKEAEKANINRDLDNLTPLDARNSLLMEPMAQHDTSYKGGVVVTPTSVPAGFFGDGKGRYDPVPVQGEAPVSYGRPSRFDEQTNLVSSAASMGSKNRLDRTYSELSVSPPRQQPRLPDLDMNYGYGR